MADHQHQRSLHLAEIQQYHNCTVKDTKFTYRDSIQIRSQKRGAFLWYKKIDGVTREAKNKTARDRGSSKKEYEAWTKGRKKLGAEGSRKDMESQEKT